MKNVSIFRKPNSPFWYIAAPNPETGKRKWQSTKIRVDDVLGRRKVLELARKHSLEAETVVPAGVAGWENWAPQALRLRYRGKTLIDALGAWKSLSLWLRDRKLSLPALIKYEHAADWIEWRTKQKRPNGRHIARNTALSNLKYFNQLMREAVRRGFAMSVPTERLNLRLDPQREKLEITEAHDRLIRVALETRPAWMRECYVIGMAQGCRLTEVQVPMDLVDEKRYVITFRGKGNKVFATRLNPVLLPLVAKARREGRRLLTTLPTQASLQWMYFFRELGLPYSFHCTRVTVVTTLARAGVPIQQAMAFVGHANSLIHRIYQRLLPQDLHRATDALGALPSLSPSECRPEKKDC